MDNYEKYVNEAFRQLKNPHYYEELKTNPLPRMKLELASPLDSAKEARWITDNEYDFLTCEHPSMAVFYMLPKVHKEPKHNPPW